MKPKFNLGEPNLESRLQATTAKHTRGLHNMENLLPKLPIADWIDVFVTWLTIHLEPVFDGVTSSA